MELAESLGIPIDDDFRLIFHKKWPDPSARANYANLGAQPANRRLTWKDFLNTDGQVPVNFDSTLLEIDKAVVAHIAHEMYELNALRDIFKESHSPTVSEVRQLLGPGIRDNLHDEARDVADLAVSYLRKTQ